MNKESENIREKSRLTYVEITIFYIVVFIIFSIIVYNQEYKKRQFDENHEIIYKQKEVIKKQSENIEELKDDILHIKKNLSEIWEIKVIAPGQDFDCHQKNGTEIITRFGGLVNDELRVLVTTKDRTEYAISRDTYSVSFSKEKGTVIPLSWTHTILVEDVTKEKLTIRIKKN